MRAAYRMLARGETTFDRAVSADDFETLDVLLPPMDEQRRIADFLDDRVARIDRMIAARRTQADLLRDARTRAIMDTILAGRFQQLGTSPWFSHGPGVGVAKVAARWNVIDCKHRTPTYVDEGYPVISPGDVTRGRLDLSVATRFVAEEDYLDLADDLRRCRPGDLVYSRNASAGIAAYVQTLEPFTMGQDVCRITSIGESQLYLAYCLNYLAQPQLEAARIGATFTRINVAEIKALVVPYIPRSEQVAIAEECDHVDTQADRRSCALTHSIALLSEYKQSLITAAVTGELDVTTAGSGIPG